MTWLAKLGAFLAAILKELLPAIANRKPKDTHYYGKNEDLQTSIDESIRNALSNDLRRGGRPEDGQAP